MPRTSNHPGRLLAGGLLLAAGAALAPAGLGGRPVPPLSPALWTVTCLAAVILLPRHPPGAVAMLLRRLAWLLPFIALLVLPATVLVPPGRRLLVGGALVARSLASAAILIALGVRLGPSGLVAGLRSLKLPGRLCHVLDDSLSSLSVVTRQAGRMLRAREARRTSTGAWPSILARPYFTTRAFGRLTAALLLRSLERAEAVDRARRARGAGECP